MSDAVESPVCGVSFALSPQGRLHVELSAGASEAGDGALGRIAKRFERGDGYGLFWLGASEPETALPPVPAFWRDLGRAFVVALCATSDLEALRGQVAVEVPREELAALAASAPPMIGGEYLTEAVLRELCARMGQAVRDELAGWQGTVEAFLRHANPIWNVVGRVCFHLAENKGDAETPFAFVATYTTRISAQARAQHLPLAQALREYTGARNKSALLALLVQVQRAAQTSAVAKDLVDSGAVFETLAWTPAEAHKFLKEIPLLESAGVVVRVPAAWRARRPPRPEAQITIGEAGGAGLGADALLDFSIGVTLEGETLTAREVREILEGTDGLALVRGRWIEIDRERLRQVLDHWSAYEKAHAAGGISLVEGLRLLAGARMDDQPAGAAATAVAEWSKVIAGAPLARALTGLRSPESLADLDPGDALRAELRPYQKVGLRWLWWLSSLGLGGCLADDMGLGKTVQVIALLTLLKKKRAPAPSLLVVPASLIANWRAEIARFAPGLRVLVAHQSEIPGAELADLPAARIDGSDVVITTYGATQNLPWLAARPWDVVVLDEAQAIKNPGAKQTRAVKALRGRLRLALTGTPVENRLGDLWSIFDFICPGLLGSAKAFSRFIKTADKRAHHGYGPLRELVRPYILRRLKTDTRVIADLPDKTEVRTFCGLTKRQAVLYQQAVDDLRAALAGIDGIKRRGVVLASLMRLKQICNHPSHWLGDGSYLPEDSGKFTRLRDIADEIAARQEKALVFTQFRELTRPLAQFLTGVFGRPGLVLSGETEVKNRKGLVDQFQREDGPPFFVLSLKAGGTGLNLTAARHVIHFDRWWNPAVENQATDRAYRIGQKSNVLVHKFVCRGTVEEKIDALIESKQDLSRQVLETGGDATLTELNDEQLLRIIGIDINSALAES
ncbi:MAG TPA: DEAD/DEAH box helicase [Polyangia bacterium]|nr:DEAD/DEAH box helicase [Polyangia bacterium]